MNKPLTIENFVFPKELFDHWEFPTDTGVIKYDDRPITVRSLLESICTLRFNYTRKMYVAAPKYMRKTTHEQRERLTTHLINSLQKVQDWGKYEVLPVSIRDADIFIQILSPELMYYAEDKLRYIFDALGSTENIRLLSLGLGRSVNYNLLGITHAKVFEEGIKYAATFDGGIDGISPIQFFTNHYAFKLNTEGVRYILRNSKSSPLDLGNISKDPRMKMAMLLDPYFDMYRNWTDSGDYYTAKGGETIFFSHHTVRDLKYRKRMETYIRNHPIEKYRNRLPHGIHPKIYFAPLIETLVEEQSAHARRYTSPKALIVPELKGDVRQLTEGIDLMLEGNRMKHCIGGQEYLSRLASGEYMFFHIDVPGYPNGATASFRTIMRFFRNEDEDENKGDGYSYVYQGRVWCLNEFHGIKNASIVYLDSEFGIAADKAMRKILSDNFQDGNPHYENYVIIEPTPIPKQFDEPLLGEAIDYSLLRNIFTEVIVTQMRGTDGLYRQMAMFTEDSKIYVVGLVLENESAELQNLVKRYMVAG